MVKPDCGTFSPTPQSYYALSDMSKMSNFDNEDVSTNLTQSSSIVSDKRVHRVEKSTSFTSDDEFSEPYIMDDIDEVCKSAEIDAVPRRKGTRKPRPASWCGATQLVRDEDTQDFDPERLKKLQESLKQADIEREVILSCLGKEYIERVTLQSHLQSICAKFGYRLEDLILQKSDKNDTSDSKEVSEIKENPVDVSYKVYRGSVGRNLVSYDDSMIDFKLQNNTCFDTSEIADDNRKGASKGKTIETSKDTIIGLNEAEQRMSTMKFSHAVCTSTPQLGLKDSSSRNYTSEENMTTKATLREISKELKNSSASVVMDSNFQSTSVGLSNGLNMGNRTKDSEIIDQSPSSGNDRQVFSDSKQKRGHMDYSDIGTTEGHPYNPRNYADRVRTTSETSTEVAGEYKAVSIEKCSNKKDHSKSFIMDGLKQKQSPVTKTEYDNTVSKRSTSEGKIVDEDIVELKGFLTDLIEENQKAAKRIVLLEKRMAKNGEKDDLDSSRSESISGSSHRPSFNRRRSYTTDDVHESVHGQSTFIRSHRRSSYSEGRTTPTSSSVSSRLFKSTLSSQQKMKPKLQRKKSRSSDSLCSNSLDVVDYENGHKSLLDREDKRISCQSPDVKEIVVTNDDNMKTVFCQASYDTNTFQYIYTIDAEMSNKEYNKLLSIINMLQEQRRKWETEVKELQSKVEILGKDKVEVVRNNNLLRQSLEAANKAIREINSKVQELKRTIVPLRDDNAKLKEQNQSYRQKFENFRKDKLKLVQEIQDLKKSKTKLEEKIVHFEAKQEMRKMGRITEESIMEGQDHNESYAERDQESGNFLKMNGASAKVSSKLPEENKRSVTVDAAESMDNVHRFYSSQQENTSKLQTTKHIRVDKFLAQSHEKSSFTEKQSSEVQDYSAIHRNSSQNHEESINRELSLERKVSERSHEVSHSVDSHVIVNREELVAEAKSSNTDTVDHMEKFKEQRNEKQSYNEKEKEYQDDLEERKTDVIIDEPRQGEGRVSQQIQMIEKRQQNVSIEQKNIQNISLVTEVNTSNVEVIKNDEDRLREIEVQNVTLMTELQNLRNRLQAYEETVATTNQQSVLLQQEQEAKRAQEAQAKQESLLQGSQGTIQRQLEKEEEHLINELTRRSPMSDRGRVSASQSTEDVSRGKEMAENNQKRRSLELLSPIHTAVIGYPIDESPQLVSPGYSNMQKESGMSRWASFSQDSLLEVKELSVRSKADVDEMRRSTAAKQSTVTHATRRDVQDSNKHVVKHISYKQPATVSNSQINAENQAIGSGYAKFNTNRQVSMSNESRNVSGSSRYRAEINMKDAPKRAYGEVKVENIRSTEQDELQSSAGVSQYHQESDISARDVRGSVKFFESYASRKMKSDMQQESSNRERHESLTDWEVQQITQGSQKSEKWQEGQNETTESARRERITSEGDERRSDRSITSSEKRHSAEAFNHASSSKNYTGRKDDVAIQSTQGSKYSMRRGDTLVDAQQNHYNNSYARGTHASNGEHAIPQERGYVMHRGSASDVRAHQEVNQVGRGADAVYEVKGVMHKQNQAAHDTGNIVRSMSRVQKHQRSVSEERNNQSRVNNTTLRVSSHDSSNTHVSNEFNVRRDNEEFGSKSKHVVAANEDAQRGRMYKHNEDSMIDHQNKQLRESRRLRQKSDRRRSQSLQNRVESNVRSEIGDYVYLANTVQVSNANSDKTGMVTRESEEVPPKLPPKKPVRGILVEKEKRMSQKLAQEALLSHQQSSLEYHQSKEEKVVSSSVKKSTSDSGRLLDEIDGHRHDVVRGIRNKENYNVGRVETDERIIDTKANNSNVIQENLEETVTSSAVTSIAQSNTRISKDTDSIAHEQEIAARQTQESRTVHDKTNDSDKRNSSTVLYLDELSGEPQGSLGRSRRTRSLRIRPKSEVYGARQNGELSSNQMKQIHMNNTFHRAGSVRTRRDIDRDRARRENRPLSLSESNLLFRSGVDVAMRHTVRHVYDDEQHSQAHERAVGGEAAYDDRGHLHYHSQEIFKGDGLNFSQTNSRFCHDSDCHSGSATLPKSSKNFRPSSKFNCEMCKDMSRRKHVSENRYCREKYFPIAHTDFV